MGIGSLPKRQQAGLSALVSPQLDVEYLAELANSGSQDELSRLGTKIAGASTYFNPEQSGTGKAFQPNIGAADANQFYQQEGKWPVGNTIYTGGGVSVPGVQNHEFRHQGGQYVLDNFSREDMVNRWGAEGGMVRDLLNYKNEGSMEAFDRPMDSAGERGTMGDTIQFMDGPMGTMKPEWTDVLRQHAGRISTDIMGDMGVPPRAVMADVGGIRKRPRTAGGGK